VVHGVETKSVNPEVAGDRALETLLPHRDLLDARTNVAISKRAAVPPSSLAVGTLFSAGSDSSAGSDRTGSGRTGSDVGPMRLRTIHPTNTTGAVSTITPPDSVHPPTLVR
jgi:hypothetical protein